MWHEFATAVSLLLILEGILPFLVPKKWRLVLSRLAQADTGSIRLAGFLSMMVGLGLLLVLRN